MNSKNVMKTGAKRYLKKKSRSTVMLDIQIVGLS
jgi:hypothetical protein